MPRFKIKWLYRVLLSFSKLCFYNGLNEILKPLVEDLKELGSETGYPYNIAGGTVYLQGEVLAVIAYTLASHHVIKKVLAVLRESVVIA